MPNFYFTFTYGSDRRNQFVRIQSRTMAEARDEMFRLYGDRWAFCYDEAGWVNPAGVTQEEQFGLSELCFINLEG